MMYKQIAAPFASRSNTIFFVNSRLHTVAKHSSCFRLSFTTRRKHVRSPLMLSELSGVHSLNEQKDHLRGDQCCDSWAIYMIVL